MFSTGQLIFAGCFVLAFIIIMIYSYRKDITLHRKYYRGSLYILLAFTVFVALLFALKSYLHP
ncbi:hypothetical protein EV197_1452 [Aquimarina brevivitae]|uniref:Uncharacterized protein n=1 Tax=Aquimarina brevivitae TaxID=323412 RepID=A0A4Q7PIF2_9FLAO|nr:hypothetical protein [Aquimarina brevivitae]RZT00216.1 hypothetical protein EV197_1452 [Aquimarina brevivitae]